MCEPAEILRCLVLDSSPGPAVEDYSSLEVDDRAFDEPSVRVNARTAKSLRIACTTHSGIDDDTAGDQSGGRQQRENREFR